MTETLPIRLTSAVFVASLVRRVQGDGGFAYVARRGDDSAGAVFVAVFRPDTGSYAMFVPAPPSLDDETAEAGGRSFVTGPEFGDGEALRQFTESEARFDPDFWLIEIESFRSDIGALITIAE